MKISQAKTVAIEAVLKSGIILKQKLSTIKKISLKTSRRDIVTDVDIEVEKLLIHTIQNSFPDHTILSEEAGLIPGQSKYEWIIDPIDGSMNYSHGHPPFRIAVCLLEEGQVIFSVLYGPTREQLFVAEKGMGATLNNEPIHVSKNSNLHDSIFMTHLSSKNLPRLRTILSLEKIYTHTSHVRIFGSGLASMCYIAEGRYDVFYNLETNPWDILPGALLITEAGGKVTDVKGAPISVDSTSVLATNGLVHEEMLKLLEDI